MGCHFGKLAEFGKAGVGAEGEKAGLGFDQGANFFDAWEVLGRTVERQKIFPERVVGCRSHAGGHFAQGPALGAGFDDGCGFLGEGKAEGVAVGDLALPCGREGLEAKPHFFGAGFGGLEDQRFGLRGFCREEGVGDHGPGVGPSEPGAALGCGEGPARAGWQGIAPARIGA